ncbi:MAG: dihydroxy-acid dehydratase [Chloroflexi bacterium]|nr:dihydroxy-acid dehydratase [Chloroflexota bacterium]MCL5108387.1 dihydroxy-acid dehydratase [Chloroflexota bacterium]
MSVPGKDRSVEIVETPERTAHRALLYSLGLTREDFAKPFVAICNSWNEIVPGCVHLRPVARAVREGIIAAGGVPFEFNTIAVCDGLAQGHVGMKYSLPSREIIAASAEIMLQAHRFDAVVFVSSCDKITPGMLMAAARVNIPAIFVPAGIMGPGVYQGKKFALPGMREYSGRHLVGEVSDEELAHIEELGCPTPGTCAMIGTANTMACLAEVLGMTLPLGATTPAVASAKLREARAAGRRVVALAREGVRPSDIMTRAAFENALRVTQAVGGSTNSLLHLPAIASELDIKLDMRDVDRANDSTPLIAKINPSGTHTMDDLHRAGGMPAVFQSLGALLNREAHNVCGRSVGEIADGAAWADREVIRPREEPYAPKGGLVTMWGSLAPEGAVVKQSAASPKMWVHEGPAICFDSMEEAVAGVLTRKVQSGSVVVIRYEGPVGGPGMREMHMVTSVMYGAGLAETTALVTDGRFSGSTRGPNIGHVSPEAAAGGPIALLHDGDVISINIPERRLELKVGEAELARRRADWRPPQRVEKGILGLYAALCGSPMSGAVWKAECKQ